MVNEPITGLPAKHPFTSLFPGCVNGFFWPEAEHQSATNEDRHSLIDDDGEVRELSADDFAGAKGGLMKSCEGL